MQLPVTTRTVTFSKCPLQACWVLTHDGTRVHHLYFSEANRSWETALNMVCAETREECEQIATDLGLHPLVVSKSVRVADYFKSLPSAIQQKFGAAFSALSKLDTEAEKLAGVRVLEASTPQEQAAKDAIIAIFES